MILYILGVLTIAGAIVADHHQAQVAEFFKKRYNGVKQELINLTHKSSYDFDKALDKSVNNIVRGKMTDVAAQIAEIQKRYQDLGKDNWTQTTTARRIRTTRTPTTKKPATTRKKKAPKAPNVFE